ncbi:Tubulin/FtsZ family, GTPase domain [Marinobacter sp. LV10R510-11A]|nr:Tubulin/FtsZ family, GTPase domain [Marinobacter sp. LV10R510-11A]
MFEIVEDSHQNAVIKVIGVGGGGGNAVRHMVESEIEGVEFIGANTDAQALSQMGANHTIQLGVSITKGLAPSASLVVCATAMRLGFTGVYRAT